MNNNLQFPESFLFGIADADLQVIGEDFTQKEENSLPTIWNYFSRNSKKVYKNQTPGLGIDRYHHWKKDIEIMKKMGVKHYRTSISMSRILKENSDVNKKAIQWYADYFKALKAAGITIYATLYHWELPQYIQEKGGWKERTTIDYFTQHTKYVAKYLGEYITEYFLINEPWCASILSYALGIHAPGETNLKHALLASHNLLLAIAASFEAIREIDSDAKISTVFNLEPTYAASLNEKDLIARTYGDGYFNRWFTDPIYLGKYPEEMVAFYADNMPQIGKADMDAIKIGTKLHAFGLNYYCGKTVKYDSNNLFKFQPVYVQQGDKNDLGWPIFTPPYYPEGLYDMIRQTYFTYKTHGLKRIYITENGMALKSELKDETINDQKRINYYREHLRQVHKACLSGIPIEAYFAWTLMDNYEWAEGYRPESAFGLIHVDHQSMKRIWKKSAHWYKDVIKTHSLK